MSRSDKIYTHLYISIYFIISFVFSYDPVFLLFFFIFLSKFQFFFVYSLVMFGEAVLSGENVAALYAGEGLFVGVR